MGNGYHDHTQTADRITRAAISGQSVMDYASQIDSGVVARKVHPKLDPKRPNGAGEIIREALDSPDHPASTPIAVIFDTTGSMGSIPETLVKKLGGLMKLLQEKQYVTDPQVLFGAINDADRGSDIPLEIGQFEASNEMDDVITKIYNTQSGGGGNSHESYELAMYFLARKTRLDCVTKRNKKGYCFFIGDEAPYDSVGHRNIEEFVGDVNAEDIATTDILAELREKFEVFWIRPTVTTNINNSEVTNALRTLFGEREIKINDPREICEVIAATIAVNEGRNIRDVANDLATGSNRDAVVRSIASAAAAIPARNITMGDL